MIVRARRATGRLGNLATVLSVLAFGGCKLTSDPSVAHILAITSGNAQTAAVGTALPSPLGVVVIDQYGSAMPTVTVSWAIAAGAGSLSAIPPRPIQAGLPR